MHPPSVIWCSPALLTTVSTDLRTARVTLATTAAGPSNHCCLSVLRRVASEELSPLEYKLVSLYLILELNDGQIVLLKRPRKLRSCQSDSLFFLLKDLYVRLKTASLSSSLNMGLQMYSLLLLYYLISSLVCNAVAFAEASEGISDEYCERILRVQTQGTRRDGHHEFRLRMEGDPEMYKPGSTYRGNNNNVPAQA